VVLRAADRLNGRLEIHTNSYSAKIADLTATPVAALHIWDTRSSLQIRLQADVTIAQGAQVASAWSAVPERSRMAYSCNQLPGQPIATALAYEPQPDPAAFAVLHLDIRVMDLLHLGPDHRRAQFSRDLDWAGQWLAP
jgi:pyridoxine/pyridoxamine 5'-phosphate oxidase